MLDGFPAGCQLGHLVVLVEELTPQSLDLLAEEGELVLVFGEFGLELDVLPAFREEFVGSGFVSLHFSPPIIDLPPLPFQNIPQSFDFRFKLTPILVILSRHIPNLLLDLRPPLHFHSPPQILQLLLLTPGQSLKLSPPSRQLIPHIRVLRLQYIVLGNARLNLRQGTLIFFL